MSRQPKILRIGSMKSACLLIQAQFVPILLYSYEAWLNVMEDQYQVMEDIFKKNIPQILSLPLVKFVKTGSPLLDNARYLVKLNEERIKK